MNTRKTDPFPHLIADGVACFRDPADAHEPARASPAFLHPPRPVGPLPADFRTIPEFDVVPGEAGPARRVRVRVGADVSLYGTGEVAGPLLRNGRRTVCWNTDSFEYDETWPGLYQSHPWVLGVRPDGSAFGVLADTTCRCEVRTGVLPGTEDAAENDVTFAVPADTPPFAVFVLERDTPAQVIAALSDLTGRPPLPPKWALGYHQSRWSYEPQDRVLDLAREFRARRIPCDVIWMDIDYMDGFRCFTFDKAKFPAPAALNESLHTLGFRSVWMIDPGIKVDPEYGVYAAGNEAGHFLQNSAGGEYHGKVWPGACAFPDFTRRQTRLWWAGLYSSFMATGMDGVWNDMNEPAIFDNVQKQMPEDNHHRADPELGGPGPHSRYHNIYGMLMVRATREGIAAARPQKRPFVLTRSNFIGGHRYAATWTGDNKSDWDHLAWSIPMALNLGLSGQPFAGPDIGGFAGNATGPLFARWMGIGALLPFARGHSIKDSIPHEPWAFGAEAEATCRLALERRSRLMPYLYTLFWEASQTGVPVARPVYFADLRNRLLRDADDSFLLGTDLLVRAAVKPDSTECDDPLPRGIWRSYEPCPRADGSSDPELPRLLVRGGAILPLGPVCQYTDERPLDPLTLIVSPDERGIASSRLYEDAGDGHDHESGVFRVSTYRAERSGDHVTVRLADEHGRMHRHPREVEVVLLLDGAVRSARGRDGQAVTIHV